MDKAQRAALLRASLDAIRGYSLPPYPKPAKPRPEPYKSRWTHGARLTYSVSQHAKEMPCEWVCRPEKLKGQNTPKPKRGAKVSALHLIAEKWRPAPINRKSAREVPP